MKIRMLYRFVDEVIYQPVMLSDSKYKCSLFNRIRNIEQGYSSLPVRAAVVKES